MGNWMNRVRSWRGEQAERDTHKRSHKRTRSHAGADRNPPALDGSAHAPDGWDFSHLTLGALSRYFVSTSRRSFLKLAAAATVLMPRWLQAEPRMDEACGPPPPASPAQASGAEGLPPLPLPATPQRRSEKKNPPRPPVIAVKIQTGSVRDWATDLNDLNNLLIWMKASLGVNFTYDAKPLSRVNLEAADVPVLYRTGHYGFEFSGEDRRRLRAYLLRGGMIIFDSCCGRKAFADSARREIEAILPDYALKPIGADHPIFNCYYQNAGQVRFTPWSHQQNRTLRSPGSSRMLGVEIACRMAVIMSPHDLSCGWDMHTHQIADCTYIESDSALKIGANLIAYATATRDLSSSAAESKAFVDAEDIRTDKFRVGQVVHEGDWNPDPVGLRNLLDTVAATTSVRLSFETEPVQVDFDQLSHYPFLYMTGHEAFTWNDAQVAAMRRYLSNGGFLFADACCGRQAFDQAFRSQVARVLSGQSNSGTRLVPTTAQHPLFSTFNQIDRVAYTPAAEHRAQGRLRQMPQLMTAAVNGRDAIVYSPMALNVGWRLRPVPYAVGYDPDSALRIGVNTVLYALSQ